MICFQCYNNQKPTNHYCRAENHHVFHAVNITALLYVQKYDSCACMQMHMLVHHAYIDTMFQTSIFNLQLAAFQFHNMTFTLNQIQWMYLSLLSTLQKLFAMNLMEDSRSCEVMPNTGSAHRTLGRVARSLSQHITVSRMLSTVCKEYIWNLTIKWWNDFVLRNTVWYINFLRIPLLPCLETLLEIVFWKSFL